ncbi:MAG: hypothetical protein IT304_00365 [Dehalococcoidia bacterium]|nr:hypothetical protein [Dehalococcoidia bacterium]
MDVDSIVQRKVRQARLRDLVAEYRASAPCAWATREGIASKLRRELTAAAGDDGLRPCCWPLRQVAPGAALDAVELLRAAEEYLAEAGARLHEEMRSWLAGHGCPSG